MRPDPFFCPLTPSIQMPLLLGPQGVTMQRITDISGCDVVVNHDLPPGNTPVALFHLLAFRSRYSYSFARTPFLAPAPTTSVPTLFLTHFVATMHTCVRGCAGLPRILELRGTDAQVRSARSLIHSILETEVG